MFVNNFGNCEPIIKILSLIDSQGNSMNPSQISPPHLQCVATLPCKIQKSKNYGFLSDDVSNQQLKVVRLNIVTSW